MHHTTYHRERKAERGDARRARFTAKIASGSESFHRRASRAVRLLHQWHGHGVGRPHRASGEIQNSADADRWDVTFMPVDEERKKFVDFGNAYHLLQSTYLVAPGAKPAKIEDVNESGVRVGGVANTATLRAAQRTAPKATFVTVPGVDVAVAAIKAGEIDCIALSRESLSGLTAKITGSRVLDGGLLNSSTAVAVPKGKMEALAYVSQFIEDAKASGLVRKAFDDMDLKNLQVAPAGMKP
jgi:polar amino acid transport system substrate-binding protein